MKRTEEDNNASLPHKRRKVFQNTPEKTNEEVDGSLSRRIINSDEHHELLSLRQRRRKNADAVIGIEPIREAGSDGEISPNKSLYATPKTTTSIYETPPAYPITISGRYDNEEGSPQSKAFEPKKSRKAEPIAVLGLDLSEAEQFKAAQETVAVSDDDYDDHDDHDSDNEAPETITKEIARERVKRLDVEAAKASKKQVIAEKTKRREKDARLKQQADSARREKNQKPTSAMNLEAEESAATDKTHRRGRKKRNIPEYLPEDILAMESHIGLPVTLASSAEDQQKSDYRNRNILFQDEKAPKDLKRGSKKVRVLRKDNKLLPPKVSAQSRYIRESWLKGRPGKRGEATFERRKYSTPFLVK